MGWSLFLHSGEISRCWCRKRSSMAAVLVQDPIIPILLWFLNFFPLKYSIKCLFYLCLLIFRKISLLHFAVSTLTFPLHVFLCKIAAIFMCLCTCVIVYPPWVLRKCGNQMSTDGTCSSQCLNGSNSKPSSNFPATFVRNCFSCQLTDRPRCSTRLIEKGTK